MALLHAMTFFFIHQNNTCNDFISSTFFTFSMVKEFVQDSFILVNFFTRIC